METQITDQDDRNCRSAVEIKTNMAFRKSSGANFGSVALVTVG
jgi:hypothetical protein